MNITWGATRRKNEAEQKMRFVEAAKQFKQAKRLYEHGKIDEAHELLCLAIKNRPAMSKYFFYRGLCYQRLGDCNRGMFDATMALSLSQGSAQAPNYNLRGECAYKLKLVDDAIADFSSAIELDNSRHIYLFNRGLCYFEKNNMEASEADLRAALELCPTHAESHLYMARVIRGKDVGAAINAMREAAAIQTDAATINELGECLMQADQFAEAAELFTRAIQLNASAKYYNNRGLARYLLDFFDEAMEDFSEALNLPLGSGRAETFFHRSNCYRTVGKSAIAIEDASTAQMTVPNNPNFLICKGLALQANGQTEEALDIFRSAATKHDVTPAWYHLAIANYYLGKHNDALRAIERVRDMSEPCGRVWELLGRINGELLEYDAGIDMYSRAIAYHTDMKAIPDDVQPLIESARRYDPASLPPVSDCPPALTPWDRLARTSVGSVQDCPQSVPTIATVIPPHTWHLFFFRGQLWLRSRHFDEAYVDLSIAVELCKEYRSAAISLVPVAEYAALVRQGKPATPPEVRPDGLSVYGVFRRTLVRDVEWLSHWGSDSVCEGTFRRRVMTLADPLDLLTALEVLGELCDMSGRHEEAIRRYTEGIEILAHRLLNSPDSYHIKERLASNQTHVATNLFELGKHEDALKAVEKAMDIVEPTPYQLYVHGRCQLALNLPTSASRTFRRALLLKSTTPPDLLGKTAYFLGIANDRREAWPEAVEAFTISYEATKKCHLPKFIHVDYDAWPPQRVAIIHERAKANQLAGRFHDAIADFTSVLEHQPTNSRALYRRAFSYKAIEDFASSAADFETARRLEPGEPAYWTSVVTGTVDVVELLPSGFEHAYVGPTVDVDELRAQAPLQFHGWGEFEGETLAMAPTVE